MQRTHAITCLVSMFVIVTWLYFTTIHHAHSRNSKMKRKRKNWSKYESEWELTNRNKRIISLSLLHSFDLFSASALTQIAQYIFLLSPFEKEGLKSRCRISFELFLVLANSNLKKNNTEKFSSNFFIRPESLSKNLCSWILIPLNLNLMWFYE